MYGPASAIVIYGWQETRYGKVIGHAWLEEKNVDLFYGSISGVLACGPYFYGMAVHFTNKGELCISAEHRAAIDDLAKRVGEQAGFYLAVEGAEEHYDNVDIYIPEEVSKS
ncbi:hypothetical protein RI367_000743 [Sorochytrium milnesiophthora]